MITKGIIKELPTKYYLGKNNTTQFNNKFIVELPIFNSSGINPDNPLNASIVEATLCYQPGSLDGYRVGDVVFVSFEDNDYSKPVILGKLYLGDEQPVGLTKSEHLEISNSAILPENTQLGDITVKNLEWVIRELHNLGILVDALQPEEETQED